MPLLVNLRHLEAHNVHLEGQLSAAELDLDSRDEMIQVTEPLSYDVEAQQVEDGLLVQGRLCLPLECQCVRCLKSFACDLKINSWTRHLPFQGEDAVPVVSDCVDLTPYAREDILLEFPQHPLCEPECHGLLRSPVGKTKHTSGKGPTEPGSPAWKELDKLKF
jgi:uncharacterized metal-binding protein YceD (DUF177 family)